MVEQGEIRISTQEIVDAPYYGKHLALSKIKEAGGPVDGFTDLKLKQGFILTHEHDYKSGHDVFKWGPEQNG